MRIITRAEWGAVGRHGFGTRKLPVREIYIHHSVTAAPKRTATLAQDKAHMRAIERIGLTRFGSISYNYVIMPSGRVFRGLTDNRIGAHTYGKNTTAIGICFAGNYQNVEPSQKQLDACAELIAHLVHRKSVSVTFTVKGHRAIMATACPGNKLYPHVTAIRKAARKLVTAGTAATDPVYTLKRTLYLRPKVRLMGSDVRTLQKELTADGYGGMTINGVFGPSTERAVKRFQKARRLNPDGVVGKQTATALGWNWSG